MKAPLAGLILLTLPALAHAAPSITITESPAYHHGQVIHVVTSALHGGDFQEVFCSQDSSPSQYVYWQVQPSGVYALDSALWNSLEVAYCRAIVWNDHHPQAPRAELDFTVVP